MTRWLSAVFILIAALSVWMFFSEKQPKLKPPTTAVLDGYMIEAVYTQYDNQGQIHTVMHTPKMTHFAQNSTSYFDQPQILAYSQQRVPWTIQAAQGSAVHNDQQIILWGGVLIHQSPQPPHYPETNITTSTMTIFPHQSYATTDQPIVISRPNMQIRGTGMQANFKTGIFVLLSSVNGSYVPPPKTNP